MVKLNKVLRLAAIIAAGVLGVFITLVILDAYANSVVSSADIDRCLAEHRSDCIQLMITRSEVVGGLRNAFYFLAALEILLTVGALIWSVRKKRRP